MDECLNCACEDNKNLMNWDNIFETFKCKSCGTKWSLSWEESWDDGWFYWQKEV